MRSLLRELAVCRWVQQICPCVAIRLLCQFETRDFSSLRPRGLGQAGRLRVFEAGDANAASEYGIPARREKASMMTFRWVSRILFLSCV